MPATLGLNETDRFRISQAEGTDRGWFDQQVSWLLFPLSSPQSIFDLATLQA